MNLMLLLKGGLTISINYKKIKKNKRKKKQKILK